MAKKDAQRELKDPTTSAARLAEIAREYPDLMLGVIAHPQVYPGLLEWIAEFGPELAKEAATEALGKASAVEGAPVKEAPAEEAPAKEVPADPKPAGAVSSEQPTSDQPASSGASASGVTAAPAPAGPATPWYRTPLTLFIAAGLVVLLVIGGVVWGVNSVLGTAGAARSPEGVAEKLVKLISEKDIFSANALIAPSEYRPMEPLLANLNEFELFDADDQQDLLLELVEMVEFTVRDEVKYKVEDIDEGIRKIRFQDGTVTIDIRNARQFADLAEKLMEPYVNIQADLAEYSTSDQRRILRDARDQIEDEVRAQFPMTLSVDDFYDDFRFEPSVMVVQEGGDWYLSPTLTQLEYLLESRQLSDRTLERGRLIPAKDVADFATPEAAFEGAMDELMIAVESGYYSDLAAVLPLAERRAVSLYGPLFGVSSGISNPWKLTDVSATSEVRGDYAIIDVERLAFEYPTTISRNDPDHEWDALQYLNNCRGITRSEDWYRYNCDYYSERYNSYQSVSDEEVTAKVTFGGVCVTIAPQSLYNSGTYCLDELPRDFEPRDVKRYYDRLAGELGFGEFAPVAVREDGRWFVSVTATYAHVISTVTDRALELHRSGRLREVLGID